jgi:methyl halide transferase
LSNHGSPEQRDGPTARGRDPGFWESYYRAGRPPWQLDVPCPPVLGALDASPDTWGRDAVVVGCGLGFEGAALSARGFDVLGLDLSAYAVARARARYRDATRLRYRVASVLSPPQDLHQRFDLALEQTCFCAIDPPDRPLYVDGVAAMLRPGGRLLAAFYMLTGEQRPPHPSDPDDLRALFGARFEILQLGPTIDSAPSRAGREWLGILARK